MEDRNSKNTAKKNGWGHLLKRCLWLLLIPLGLILARLAKGDPEGVERLFSAKIYPWIANAVSSLTSRIYGSLAEVLIIAGVALIVLFIIWNFVRLFMRRIKPVRILHKIVSLGITAGVLLVLFYSMWGFNYYRPTLSALMELDVRERSNDELETLCIKLRDDAIALRAQVQEDGDGVFYVKEGYRTVFSELPAAYRTLSEKLDIIRCEPVAAKGVKLSYAMSYTGISGIYIPFTAEANVNTDQPPLLLYNAAAHEMAHFQGVAREDEANFIAYLACIESDDPAIRYSGVMSALIYSANQLYSVDAAAHSALVSSYSEGMRRDINAYNVYWKSFEGPVEEFTDDLNDSYLKFNDQENGVKSYGMMVDLLLAYYSG